MNRPVAVLDDDVVVEARVRRAVVAIELAVLHGDDATVERGEDGNADVHLAEAPDVRVDSGVAVVGLRAARVVADTGSGIEIDEVVRVEVAPEDAQRAGRR